MPNFTAKWNTEKSNINQKERTITGLISFSEAKTLERNFYALQKRTGEDPNFRWETIINPPGPAGDLERVENWEFNIGGDNNNASSRNWYIVARIGETDDNYQGVYRFVLNENAFGNKEPNENIFSGLFKLEDKNKIEDESLYMTGLSNNTIYTLNPNTGVATRLSNRTNFSRRNGPIEERTTQLYPQDIQLIDQTDGSESRIYMLGALPPGLFLVNFLERSGTRGEASRIERSPNDFNLTNLDIEAFATSDTEIWLISRSILYNLDPESFVATETSSFLGVVTQGLAYGSFNDFDDDRLYHHHDGILQSIDLNTGILQFNEISTIQYLRDLEFVQNNLYGLKQEAVYKIESDGSSRKLGESSNIKVALEEFEEEKDPRGIASNGEDLYMIGNRTKALYQIDLDEESEREGQAIKIVDIDLEGVGETEAGRIFYFNENLYMYGKNSKQIFILNTLDGSLTQLPIYGFGASNVVLTGLTERNGSLYAVGFSGETGSLFTLDKTTGIASRSGFSDNFGPVDQTFPTALAYTSETPGICYMTGTQHDNKFKQAALYTLNLENGIATKIGSDDIINFGVKEHSPSGLAYIPSQENNSTGTLYMVGTATAKLYTINIDETSDEYGTAKAVDSAVRGFNINEFAPQGLTYIESKTRVFLGDPEEFSGAIAPTRIYGITEPVVRKSPFYLDVTWSKDINEENFRDEHITFSPSDGIAARIENVGTEGTFYHFRIRVTVGWESGNGSILILLPSVDESPQITKRIEIDLDIPTYDNQSWQIWTGSGRWEIIESQKSLLDPTPLRVQLKNSIRLPKPSDFFIEKIVNNEKFTSSEEILSVSGTKEDVRLKIRLPSNESGLLRIGIKVNSLVNRRGVLGPVLNSYSSFFEFDTDLG